MLPEAAGDRLEINGSKRPPQSGATASSAVNRIANVENVVCSVETMSRHPELYHYTKPTAFEGIIRSQTLWCSHYREMLDTEEVRLMRVLLPPAVAPRMDAIVEKLNRKKRRLWNASGRGAQTGVI
jgi:hypothetical protein